MKNIPGVHRITRKNAAQNGVPGSGKRQETGSYIIQFKSTFKEIGRLQLTTQIYPETKNATSILVEMKTMLKEMNRDKALSQLLKLKNKEVKIYDMYRLWKVGKEHLIHGNEAKNLLKELSKHINGTHYSKVTKVSWNTWLKTYINKGFITNDDVVSDLPRIIAVMRTYYANEKKATMYNRSRTMFMSFLTKHCKHSNESPTYQALANCKRLNEGVRQLHHPLETPVDLDDICEKIQARIHLDQNTKNIYCEVVRMMCLHPFRPTEFLDLKFSRDERTGHLNIEGTKTIRANRIVPSIIYPKYYNRSNKKLHKVTNAALSYVLRSCNIDQTPRDFRRTCLIWYENAQISRSHVQYYAGHAAKTMTDLYQGGRALSLSELNADKEKFETWLKDSRKHALDNRQKKPWVQNSEMYFENLKAPSE